MSNMKVTAATITSSPSKITYMANGMHMSYGNVLSLVDMIMQRTLDYTIPEIKSWIQNYVAKRTGQLQDDLINTLMTSAWIGQQLKLELGTMVDYAKYVNKMPAYMLQHEFEWGKAYYYGYHGWVYLNDPNAQSGFWGLLRMEGRRALRANFKRARDDWCGLMGVSGQFIQRSLKVVI